MGPCGGQSSITKKNRLNSFGDMYVARKSPQAGRPTDQQTLNQIRSELTKTYKTINIFEIRETFFLLGRKSEQTPCFRYLTLDSELILSSYHPLCCGYSKHFSVQFCIFHRQYNLAVILIVPSFLNE